jgi:flagella basal body P-ring formation protein FlgA
MQQNTVANNKAAAPLAFHKGEPVATHGDAAPAVGFLTHGRRKFDAVRRRAVRHAGILACAFLGQASSQAATWHSIDDIGQVAEAFLAEHIGAADDKTTLKASPLDPRLQLPACEQALAAFLQRGSKMSSRMTVGVRCAGAKPWKIFVTVDVIVTESVLVASHSLPRGHVLTAADLSLAERDVSSLTAGYLTRPTELVGRRLKFSLIEGRVLTPSMMKADIVIRRGQSVTLTIRSKSLNISMEGKALMDGSVNQRIKVENSLSRRIVEGIVRSPQHVEVLVF